ncbi:phosphotransferase system lactose/cellobiose-specific IIB subunit [Clostridium sp. DL-VIII]|uniref:PTS sugar transporter subunit IIB n=1 Tax=Clostridium sp. DL-VIII TaxID=641107 RepID=UPI00023B0591|nr:PTS sugar transporter subunit IIB [Clostridium sp. DL-VIII]EHJ00852.1 phosphotransferase system lactose/cellobiose-specific IIB subunit [Clostridium sp. DL-VIII]
MIKIRLFCAAGMSTSLLVSKMKEAAKSKGVEADIEAFPESQMDKNLDGVNVALLGPQVAYTLPKAKKICESKGVPIDVIPMVDYGMMNGGKVLDFALKVAGK